MAGHVTNPATKFEYSTTIRSWVTTYNVSHWLPLKMRTRPLRMRWITWPVCRGSKTITYLESPTPICLFTIQLLLGYDDDQGSFTLEPSYVKAVFGRNGAQKWRFLENGGRNLRFFVSRPPKGTSLRGTVSFEVFCVKIGCSLSQEPKK